MLTTRYYLLFILLLLGMSTSAQQSVELQVVTRQSHHSFEYKPGFSLNIVGEAADITIKAADIKTIELDLKIIAKHPERSVAELDLAKMKFINSRLGAIWYLRNYVSLNKNDKEPKATLKASYVLTVPKSCSVNLNNKLGKVEVTGLDAELTATGEYATFLLKDISAKVLIDSYLGDINSTNLSGGLFIKSNRSDIVIDRMKGSGVIVAEYATIIVRAGQGLADLNINAKYSSIQFNDDAKAGYNFDLVANHGKIEHPEFMRFKITRTEARKQATLYADGKKPNVTITTSYGDITITTN